MAALPLLVGKSLRRAQPGPPAPPRHGGRLSAQTRRQERGREDVDRTCGLDVDTLTWTRSVGRGQLPLPRAGAASAQRRPGPELPRSAGLRRCLSGWLLLFCCSHACLWHLSQLLVHGASQRQGASLVHLGSAKLARSSIRQDLFCAPWRPEGSQNLEINEQWRIPEVSLFFLH